MQKERTKKHMQNKHAQNEGHPRKKERKLKKHEGEKIGPAGDLFADKTQER